MQIRLLFLLISLVPFTASACSSENGSITGVAFPAAEGVEVRALVNGKQVATANPNVHDGRFIMTVPSGIYEVRLSVPNAEFPVVFKAVAVQSGKTTDLSNITTSIPASGSPSSFFYASPIEGVNWASGKIRVTGTGLPPVDAPNPSVSREAARRAAHADAQRKLVKAISQIKVSPNKSLKSKLGENKFTEKIEGFIRGYAVTDERELEGGKIEVDMELPLTGQNGLSHYLGQ